MAEFEYQLKFVVSEPEDMVEIEGILRDIDADRGRVVLMPEGITAEAIYEKSQWLVEICKRERFRYGPRLHIDLFGNQSGV
jgi:7-carboxy-7-deazaguanine synthase